MTKSVRNMLLGALALTLIVPAVGMAQNSDTETATASATIVSPITITLGTNLDFGDIVASASAGTVTVAPDGTATATTVNLLGGTSPATFTVAGHAGALFSVTPIGTIALTGAGDPMFATLVSNCDGGTCVVGDPLAVGGTLSVGGAQAPGAYSTTFDVTVSYQ